MKGAAVFKKKKNDFRTKSTFWSRCGFCAVCEPTQTNWTLCPTYLSPVLSTECENIWSSSCFCKRLACWSVWGEILIGRWHRTLSCRKKKNNTYIFTRITSLKYPFDAFTPQTAAMATRFRHLHRAQQKTSRLRSWTVLCHGCLISVKRSLISRISQVRYRVTTVWGNYHTGGTKFTAYLT